EPDDLAGRRLRHDDCGRRRAIIRDAERGAVRHDAYGPPQRELALLGQIAINLELGEAPWVRGRCPHAGFEQALVIAVILLQMMGPKEETFRPRNFGVPGHYRISQIAG